MEGSGGNFKLLTHSLHHLPRLTTRIRAGRGNGTATLEAKLLQQIAALREEVLYVIFLNLHKAYDALDRSRCLEILEGYGVGLQACRFLRTYWGRLSMVCYTR